MGEIKVLVSGASGKMGREVCRAVIKDSLLQLVGAVDRTNIGKDIGSLIGSEPLNIAVSGELAAGLDSCRPEVVIDFTAPAGVMENIRTVLKVGVHIVVGTTGLTPENLQEIEGLCKEYSVNALVAPNFAVGALLMMRFAAAAAKYFPQVEIIELHHDQKLDAPSGTSIKTAEMILAGRDTQASATIGEEKIKGVRGGEMNGIHLHSVRLPGLIAHQEVIFGGEGQTLTIRHDSMSRESFMPGVMLAVKMVPGRPGLTYGLEHYLF